MIINKQKLKEAVDYINSIDIIEDNISELLLNFDLSKTDKENLFYDDLDLRSKFDVLVKLLNGSYDNKIKEYLHKELMFKNIHNDAFKLL